MVHYVEQTLDEWKESCAKSELVREDNELSFFDDSGCICCYNENTNIIIGAYITEEYYNKHFQFRKSSIKPNSGWYS